jgi:hypothetical protein
MLLSVNKRTHFVHLHVLFHFYGLSGDMYFPTKQDNQEAAVHYTVTIWGNLDIDGRIILKLINGS